MASFTCPRCNGRGTEKATTITNNNVVVKEVNCSMCKGTGIVDAYGNSKTF